MNRLKYLGMFLSAYLVVTVVYIMLPFGVNLSRVKVNTASVGFDGITKAEAFENTYNETILGSKEVLLPVTTLLADKYTASKESNVATVTAAGKTYSNGAAHNALDIQTEKRALLNGKHLVHANKDGKYDDDCAHTQLVAPVDGTIGNLGDYYITVIPSKGSALEGITIYLYHLQKDDNLKAGQEVVAGETLIGEMCNLGNSEGTHLHMQLKIGTTSLTSWMYTRDKDKDEDISKDISIVLHESVEKLKGGFKDSGDSIPYAFAEKVNEYNNKTTE